jgi:hypothetical protein
VANSTAFFVMNDKNLSMNIMSCTDGRSGYSDTLSSYLWDALHEGNVDVIACLPNPRALAELP